MELKAVINRLMEIYNNKVSKKQILTEEEIGFVRSNILELKKADEISQDVKRGYYLFCAHSEELGTSLEKKVNYVCLSGDQKEIMQLLKHNGLRLPSRVVLVHAIEGKENKLKCINELDEPIRTYVMDGYVRTEGSDEEKKAWNDKIIIIKDVTELGIQKLDLLPDDIMIRMDKEYVGSWQTQLYSKKTYRDILEKMDRMLKDVKPAKKSDAKSELKAFFQVIEVLSAIYFDDEEGPETQVSSRSLEGGILHGKCVCEGYAEILRNALALKCVECKFIKGTDPKRGNTHAWNQVKIGKHWFNVDFTWDRDFIRSTIEKHKELPIDLLMSDKEFSGHECYSKYRFNEEKCDFSLIEFHKALRRKGVRIHKSR